MKSSRQAEPRRKHRLTRLGFHFIFVGAFAMLGGALRGFNLLLILAGLLVAALITQWRWSRRSVESVRLDRRLPTEAFAGKPFRIRYRLRNHSRWMPVWMLRIEDRIESIDRTEKAVAVCAVGMISAGQTRVPDCDCTITRRGRYRFGPVGLMTTFPFALFSSRQVIEAKSELLVFPKLVGFRGRWHKRLVSRSGGTSTTARRSGSVEGEFFGLREWQTGDSPKWIHWRTTARLMEPAVRQFEQQRRFDCCLLVDAFCAEETDDEMVELAISVAASLLVRLVGAPSNRVVLSVAGKQNAAVMGGGMSGKRRMLECLAEVEPAPQVDVEEAVQRGIQLVGRAQDLIIISPRTMKQVKQVKPSFQSTVAPWVRRGRFRWIDVSSSLDRWIVATAESSDPADVRASAQIVSTRDQEEGGRVESR